EFERCQLSLILVIKLVAVGKPFHNVPPPVVVLVNGSGSADQLTHYGHWFVHINFPIRIFMWKNIPRGDLFPGPLEVIVTAAVFDDVVVRHIYFVDVPLGDPPAILQHFRPVTGLRRRSSEADVASFSGPENIPRRKTRW